MERQPSPGMLGVTPDLGTFPVEEKALWTLGLIVLVLALRWGLVRLVRSRSEVIRDWQRRATLVIRSGATAIMFLGTVAIWAPELSDFALSITAFGVAIVIATKELLMCLAGGIVRSTSGAFTIGDWIEIGEHSGEVVEITGISTQLQEVDRVEFEYTGRVVTLPNSLFLTIPVVNHSFRRRYIFHEFVITSEPLDDAAGVRHRIEAALAEAAADFADVAQRYHAVIQKRTGIVLPAPGPEVRIRTNELAKLRFEARLFCPRERAGDMEQAATMAWLAATAPPRADRSA